MSYVREKFDSKLLKYNRAEMYCTDNEGKTVILGRYVRTLTSKVYQYIAALRKMFMLMN